MMVSKLYKIHKEMYIIKLYKRNLMIVKRKIYLICEKC